jgi:hypothetical protein
MHRLQKGALLNKEFQQQGLSKGQTKTKQFFQANVSSKKRTNKFDFTTMLLSGAK